MNIFPILLFVCLIIYHANSAPIANTNGANTVLVANGKLIDDLTCKTDDGRIEIPINGKIRVGANTCKVCTCTVSGFSCEDQCETIPASTSIGAPGESSTTAISSSSPSPDQLILSSTIPSQAVSNPNSNGVSLTNSTISPSRIENSDNDTTSVIAGGPCARIAVNGLVPSREFAFMDCSEVYLAGKRTSGMYEIWPRTSPKPFRVFCDMDTDGGGWTVLQRRGDYNQQSNFFVTWSSYKRGFGDLNRDFWLGNEKIHALTNQDEYRLHIDMEDFNDQSRFVDYEWFFVTDEQTKYTLNLGRYMTTSTGGDSLSYNRGMRFTTRDQDNDQSMSGQCAENYKSGWWHAGCTLANLNGLYLRGNDSTATGVFWNNWLGAKYSLKSCAMKVRPTGFNTEMLT
ncbi:unnamed protein product [Rotaria socialis]|uniref:Fibrinogen C-terminal domain-containing protein n=1 Tax=Rotaria socialis TaxID=392032 RepID=A0A821KY16_9BILA|nr:unnamed protein product [Rotaria socialis]CAF3374457.1 unnamed protein product [Rotaria socialis]CAF3402875.1 unnamed protein product [Rotaria socialis]CAF3413638.1 unnamed protein product [Rotaria socialis]CAF3472855.1 unnamed protein product [Rotaria socialis]